jgi:hypothetical protein
MADNTPLGDPIIEEVVEGVIRAAIRASLASWALDSVKVSAYWLRDENEADNIKGKEPPFVFIMASPNTDEGFFSPLRKVNVEIKVVTLQNEDVYAGAYSGRNVYAAVRRVFDTAQYLNFSSPIGASAWRVTGASVGAGEVEGFEEASFTVELQLSI